MWKSTFSLILLAFGLSSFGQQDQSALLNTKKDFRPYEFKLGFNALRTGRTVFGSEVKTHEVQGLLALYRYVLVLDVGIEESNRGDGFGYETKGSYFRAGVDWNFVKNQSSGNVLSLGLRYARAGFEEDLLYVADEGFGEQTYSFSNPDLNARWFELALNIRGKIVSNLYMGMTLRWQTFRKLSGEGELKAFEIPGFGKTKRDNSTAFDYYIMWRIPFGEG